MKQHLAEIAAEHGDRFIARIADYDSFDEDTNARVRQGIELEYLGDDIFHSTDVDLRFTAICSEGPVWEWIANVE